VVAASLGGGWAVDEWLAMPRDKSCRPSEEFLFAFLLTVAACTVLGMCVHVRLCVNFIIMKL